MGWTCKSSLRLLISDVKCRLEQARRSLQMEVFVTEYKYLRDINLLT